MTRVVIIARTRISESDVCIGAIDIDTHRMVRLHDNNGRNFRRDYPFDVGQVWNARLFPKRSRPPHVEDTFAVQLSRVQEPFDLKGYLDGARDRLPIWTGGPESIFDGKLHVHPYTGAAALYGDREQSAGSLGLWIPDGQLSKRMEDRYENRQFYYYYVDPSQRERLKLKFTGIAPSPETVPAGSIISLSLARWWRPGGSLRVEQCTPMVCDILWTPK